MGDVYEDVWCSKRHCLNAAGGVHRGVNISDREEFEDVFVFINQEYVVVFFKV